MQSLEATENLKHRESNHRLYYSSVPIRLTTFLKEAPLDPEIISTGKEKDATSLVKSDLATLQREQKELNTKHVPKAETDIKAVSPLKQHLQIIRYGGLLNHTDSEPYLFKFDPKSLSKAEQQLIRYGTSAHINDETHPKSCCLSDDRHSASKLCTSSFLSDCGYASLYDSVKSNDKVNHLSNLPTTSNMNRKMPKSVLKKSAKRQDTAYKLILETKKHPKLSRRCKSSSSAYSRPVQAISEAKPCTKSKSYGENDYLRLDNFFHPIELISYKKRRRPIGNMDRELWRQCVRWLIDTGVLPAQHRTAQRHAVVFDLAQTLRDGVILCNLLNVIRPGAVDFAKINLRPQMLQFLCMQNILTVLDSLENVFHIPAEDLFQPEDLYDMTDIPKVLRVLSMLSQRPEAQSKYNPFPESSYHSSRTLSREEEDEEIYRNLPDLASERELADEEELYDSVAEEREEEGIYGSLIAAKPSISPSKDKRSCCITEIIETERNYVQHLEMIIGKFLNLMRGKLQINQLKTIFMNHEVLLSDHRVFFSDITAAKNASAKSMSQPFLRQKLTDPVVIFFLAMPYSNGMRVIQERFIILSEKFLHYGTYCSGLTDAQDLLEEIMKSDEMRMFVEDLQNQASPSKFKLRELLCVPMQRVLKYHLLVKELNKHTPDTHPDKKEMAKALEAMQEVSHYVNEVKRDSEMLININKVSSCLLSYNMQTPLYHYGRLLKDGELKIKGSQDKNPKTRNAFLFDQALFMTKAERNGAYSLKDLVRLKEYRLNESLASVKGGKWSWSMTLEGITSGSYVLYAKNESERAKWLEGLKNAFDNINPHAIKSKEHSFVMHTFIEPSQCSYCNKLFLGTFYQGYVCSRTGAKSHKTCLAETLKLIETGQLGVQGKVKEGAPPVPQRIGITRTPTLPTGKPTNISVNQRPISTPVGITGKAYKAHRDYNGKPHPPFSGANFITFCVGEQIEVIEQVTSDWWVGYSMSQFDRRGYFPASHVSPLTQRISSSKPTGNYLPTNVSVQNSTQAPFTQRPSTMKSQNTTSLEDSPWYAGTMDRGGAENLLAGKPSGTFLIRTRDGHLAISLCYQSDMKHIKINQTPDNMYYVAECRNFRSVQDLVKYYQENTMSTSFLGLETNLKVPYRDKNFFPDHGKTTPSRTSQGGFPQQGAAGHAGHPGHPTDMNYRGSPIHVISNGVRRISIASTDGRAHDFISHGRVLYDFQPRSSQEIPLREGEIVNVINKAGGAHGWWKGELGGMVGYFPASFINELD